MKATKVSMKVGDKGVEAEHVVDGTQVRVRPPKDLTLAEGERLEVVIE